MNDSWKVTRVDFSEGTTSGGSVYYTDTAQNRLSINLAPDMREVPANSIPPTTFVFRGLTFEQSRAKIDELMRFLQGATR